jgi:Arm DNA-binding domain
MRQVGNKLTAAIVARAKKPGYYGDGLCLWLQVGRCGTKSWLLRYMIGGRVRSMGLGPLHSVTLAEAREKAREARSQIKQGQRSARWKGRPAALAESVI